MAGIEGQVGQLGANIARHAPVDGKQAHIVGWTKRFTKLPRDIGPAGHVRRVVENRITEQNDVRHSSRKHRHAAVDVQRLAGDVAGLAADEEGDGGADVLAFTHSAHWDALVERFLLRIG